MTACGLGLLLALDVPVSEAADPLLSWHSPAACPTESAVRQSVQSLLDESLEAVDVRGIHAHAVVVATQLGFALELVLDTPLGTAAAEHFDAPRCETLAGVVALKIALAATRSAAAPVYRQPAEYARWSARITLGLAPSGLPGVGPALDLAGARRLGPVQLELGAGYGFPNAVRYPQRPSIGANFDLLLGLVRACVRPELGRFQLPICVGAELGLLRADGFGVEHAHSAMRPYYAAVLETRLGVRVTAQLSLLLGVEGRLALTRPSFVVRNLEPFYTLERVGTYVRVGAEWIFE